MGKEIYILGIGHNTITTIDLCRDCGYTIKGLIHYNDDRTGELFFGHKIIGSFKEYLNEDFCQGRNFALSMGNMQIKSSLFSQIMELGGNVPTLVHPSSYISPNSRIGKGVQIMQHCVVEGDVEIGEDTSITVNTVIAHSVKIGAHNLISGNVMVGAYVSIGNYNHIGQGSVVVSGKVGHIGDNCILGAGAVLVSDMDSNCVYKGNPARFLRPTIRRAYKGGDNPQNL